MNFPILIIERPHRFPPTAWTAYSATDIAEAACAAAGDNYEWPDEPTMEDEIEAIGHDLHALDVIASEEDFFFWVGDIQGGHDSWILDEGGLPKYPVGGHGKTGQMYAAGLAFLHELSADVLIEGEDGDLVQSPEFRARWLAWLTARREARSERERAEAARKADYAATVEVWRRGLGAADAQRLMALEADLEAARGKPRKRLMRKLRDAEIALGRPRFD